MSSQTVIKTLIQHLVTYDKPITSNADAMESLDNAIFESSSHKFKTYNDLVSSFLSDCKKADSFTSFLHNSCNIDADNLDAGSLDGLDAGGLHEISPEDVVAEIGTLQHLTDNNFTINDLKFNVPTTLNTKQSYVIDALYTWWAKASLDRIENLYGLTFGANSFVNEIDVSFASLNPSSIAEVETKYKVNFDSTVTASKLSLNLSTTYFSTVDPTDKNGGIIGGIFSDVAILHEFVHALASANIPGNYYFPTVFTEGIAELIRGADERLKNFNPTYNTVRSYFVPTTFSGVSADGYALYFVFWRYFLVQTATDSAKNPVWLPSGGTPTHGQLLSAGTIPHAYSSWSRTFPDGLITIDSQKYISIPNGWQGRLWHYPWWCGRIYWANGARNQNTGIATRAGVTYNNLQRDFLYNQRSLLQKNIIHDKLLIDFGEANNNSTTDLVIDYPADFIDTTDKNTIIKMKIKVMKDDSDVLFCFKPLKHTVGIDFGDNTYSTFRYNGTYGGMLHTYKHSGTYTVYIRNENITDCVHMIEPSYFDRNISFAPDSLYALVYEVSELKIISGKYQSETLIDFYINPYFVNGFKLYTDDIGIKDIPSQTTFGKSPIVTSYHTRKVNPYGFHLNYQKNLTQLYVPYGQYSEYNSYLNLIGSHIQSLYIYGDCDIVNVKNEYAIDNIYCGKNITYIDVSNLATTKTNISYLHTYSNVPITLYNSKEYDVKLDKCLFSTTNIAIFVRSTIYDFMHKKYDDINFISEEGT